MTKSAFILLCLVVMSPINAQDLPQENNTWFQAGKTELRKKLAYQPVTTRARNVILFVADGNGIVSNYVTRLWFGQSQGNYGDEAVLPHEAFPHLALIKTYNTNAQTPDSAGTATALLSGVKTKAGVTGVDETLNRRDCMGVDNASVANMAEIMSAAGKSVGIVSTARITHATPAGAYAHAADRSYEDSSKMPRGCTQPDIAHQLIDQMSKGVVDIAMGGGRRHFLPNKIKDQEGRKGRRIDGKNLIDEARLGGVQYAWNLNSFEQLDGTDLSSAPILALFESSHMRYEIDRTDEPSLAQMTAVSINALSNNTEGYFLLVEAGRVDHANHAGNLHRMLTEGIAASEAIAQAVAMTSSADTLIIVTADHAHAIGTNGYCGRGTPIAGLCYGIDNSGERYEPELVLADDGKPYTVVNYLNGSGSVLTMQRDGQYSGSRRTLTQQQVTDPDYIQQALIPRSSETHSGVDVAAYARGPWAHLVDGTVEQNYLFHVMYYAVFGE